MLLRSGDIRDQSLKWSKIDRNFACFGPQFFWRGAPPPEFLDLHYKIDTGSDHVAKFRGDRPRDLGERVAKKNITSKTEDLPLLRTGGLKNDARRPVKNLILISRVLGLGTQVLVNITGLTSW